MSDKFSCPKCGAECWRDKANVGVGYQYGPWKCTVCGWWEWDCNEVSDIRHTPEPWQATGHFVRTDELNPKTIACTNYRNNTLREAPYYNEGNAQRIVDCVNACIGIPSLALVSGQIAELQRAAKALTNVLPEDIDDYPDLASYRQVEKAANLVKRILFSMQELIHD